MATITQDSGNHWQAYNGDNIEVCASLPSNSIHYSVFSVPFASLYTYSPSERDMGNCATHEEFYSHFSFLARELIRVMKPGRNVSIHSMDLPTSKVRDGYIGLADFPGGLIRVMQEAGFIWHSKVTIWKDPVTAMQRTKALGLLHKQLKKDSAMSRMGIPDYVHTFRKPGENAEPIEHTAEQYPVEKWQQIASPTWDMISSSQAPIWPDIDMTDTLQYTTARDPEDEKHICPLQLGVYKRCLELWTNPGDIVLEPFGGIGSGGHVALGGDTREGKLEQPRRVVLVELKPSYYRIAVDNMRRVEPGAKGQQTGLFNLAPTTVQVATPPDEIDYEEGDAF